MKLTKLIAPMSILLFLAGTFVGACAVRKNILTQHMLAAMEVEDVATVRTLLDKWPCPVNARRTDCDTVLMWAFWKGDNETVRRCVLAGADLEARDAGGLTALLLASMKGDRRAARLFLDHGAEVNARTPNPGADSGARFILHYCGPLPTGKTPLHLAVDPHVYQHFHGPDRDLCEMLLAKGADPNARDEQGNTPLHDAAYRTCPEVVELLIARGADVNAKNVAGDTPLHDAADWGGLDNMRLLISRGADVKARNEKGDTPLHWAAKCLSAEGVELLLSKGAEVDAANKAGLTPLATARAQNTNRMTNDASLRLAWIIALLKKHGAKE